MSSSKGTARCRISPIVIDLGLQFLSFSVVMELSVEILIVGAVIYFGWNNPFQKIRAIG